MKFFRSHPYLTLTFICLFLFLTGIWGYPLFDVDEPRYAETAREMLTTPGDWITPHFNWIIRFDKPPLFYWLIALCFKIFGISGGAARLVNVLATTFMAVFLFGWVKRSRGLTMAWMAALIWITMTEIFILSRWAITDMLLATCTGALWVSLFLVVHHSRKWYLAAAVFGALGILTKGPVAIALPGLTFLIYTAWQDREALKSLGSKWALMGIGLFLLLGVPWYVLVTMANPDTFIKSFFLLHNVERFSGTVSGHSGTWWYYLPVLLVGAMPWSLFLPGTVQALILDRNRLGPLEKYALVWAGVVFGFFTIAGTKLLTYVLPGFVPVAVLIAWYWRLQMTIPAESSLFSDPPKVYSLRNVGLWIGVGLFFIATLLLIFQSARLIPDELKSIIQMYRFYVLLGVCLFTCITGLVLARGRQNLNRAFVGVAIGSYLIFLTMGNLIIPHVNTLVQDDASRFAAMAKRNNVAMATYHMKKTSLVFYTQRPVYFIFKNDTMVSLSPEFLPNHTLFQSDKKAPTLSRIPEKIYVMVRNSQLQEFQNVQSRNHPAEIERGRVYSLFQITHPTIYLEANQ